MGDNLSSTSFDTKGKTCDYVDTDGIIWIYLDKEYGFDDWGGIPKEE